MFDAPPWLLANTSGSDVHHMARTIEWIREGDLVEFKSICGRPWKGITLPRADLVFVSGGPPKSVKVCAHCLRRFGRHVQSVTKTMAKLEAADARGRGDGA